MFEIYLDDHPAGMMYPYPVIYTGGVNPLLWRPLTGIDSFNVLPYRFDLTPFLGLLHASMGHTLSIRVAHNTQMGVWYLDPVLLYELGDATVVSGALLYASLAIDYFTRNVSSSIELAFHAAELEVRGRLEYDGCVREVGILGRFRADANYTTIGSSGGPTTPPDNRSVAGRSTGSLCFTEKVSSLHLSDGLPTRPACSSQVTFEFPYHIWLRQRHGDDGGHEIESNVSYGQHGSVSTGHIPWTWSHDYDGSAVYNQSGGGQPGPQSNIANMTYRVDMLGRNNCYDRRLSALNGSITQNSGAEWECWTSSQTNQALPAIGFDRSLGVASHAATEAALRAIVI